MKIIDAVNFGLPFITTSIGVEGLDFRHNRECLIANTPSLFTEAVINLCRDTKLQEKLITNADKALREKYKADIALQKRKEVYQKIFKSSN